MTSIDKIKNIAIIAHVDHGKTTLVDKLLTQSGTLDQRKQENERMMDSNALEQERGITILAKNTAIKYKEYHINIVDTPGHADFGGEVERILSMVDSVLLLVDAADGPMPQTRFVTQKAFAHGLKPIVVINKVDKPSARCDWVINKLFDLFADLGATDEQLDFEIIYASALNGWANSENIQSENMNYLFEQIIKLVPKPTGDPKKPFAMQISALDFNSYIGVIGIGRVLDGNINLKDRVLINQKDGTQKEAKVAKILGYLGLERHDINSANAGDIIAIAGLGDLKISDTISSIENPKVLPPLSVDKPTITMNFSVNTSPFAGQDGKYVTSNTIYARLEQELKHNVALVVEKTENPDTFKVSGRGELHLGILLENMRREGYEIAISKPQVIIKTDENGNETEPYEEVTLDIKSQMQGSVIDNLNQRGAKLTNMEPDSFGRIRLSFVCPSRGLIGFASEFMNLTSGDGLFFHNFYKYDKKATNIIGKRKNGVLISNATGKALAFALFNLQNRGKLFLKHAQDVYEGQVIGIHSRDNDLTVNCLKGKQLTNVRASGTDEAIVLTTPIKMNLEEAMTFIDDDELVEITPKEIRIRKRHLTESGRKKATRK